jgi:hypothetical protein
MPTSLAYIWGWFVKLHGTRQIGVSASPITFAEIYAFCKLYSVIMKEWEIDVITKLDYIALVELQRDD